MPIAIYLKGLKTAFLPQNGINVISERVSRVFILYGVPKLKQFDIDQNQHTELETGFFCLPCGTISSDQNAVKQITLVYI